MRCADWHIYYIVTSTDHVIVYYANITLRVSSVKLHSRAFRRCHDTCHGTLFLLSMYGVLPACALYRTHHGSQDTVLCDVTSGGRGQNSFHS